MQFSKTPVFKGHGYAEELNPKYRRYMEVYLYHLILLDFSCNQSLL